MQSATKATTINHFHEKLLKLKVSPHTAQQQRVRHCIGSNVTSMCTEHAQHSPWT